MFDANSEQILPAPELLLRWNTHSTVISNSFDRIFGCVLPPPELLLRWYTYSTVIFHNQKLSVGQKYTIGILETKNIKNVETDFFDKSPIRRPPLHRNYCWRRSQINSNFDERIVFEDFRSKNIIKKIFIYTSLGNLPIPKPEALRVTDIYYKV